VRLKISKSRGKVGHIDILLYSNITDNCRSKMLSLDVAPRRIDVGSRMMIISCVLLSGCGKHSDSMNHDQC
jgi:hypothetical protein